MGQGGCHEYGQFVLTNTERYRNVLAAWFWSLKVTDRLVKATHR
jgi:hypothetical protein